ncbi:hypothetical protein JW960_26460 [candidate division KSB1 bacterium]|nr:hypothetical protein [candidate division KSB1 bacterium]
MVREKIDIVATLGPSTQNLISDLLDAGATAFRLNCSHLTMEQFREWLRKIDAISVQREQHIPVWLDLQGAKIRIGELIQPIMVNEGARVTFVFNAKQEDERIPLPHKEIFDTIVKGDEISIDDGRVILTSEIIRDNSFTAIVTTGGQLNSFKGFNKAHYHDYLREISPRDLAFINATYNISSIGYAISFVQTPDELELIRKYTHNRPVICKIERLRTFSRLIDLALLSDGLWLCRGDLGVEANIYNLFEFEKIFIQNLNKIDKPYLIAGQVLEHMVRNSQPSRSEVAHLGYLIENGFHGAVLSDETAIGDDPVKAVQFCDRFFHHLQSIHIQK